MACSLHLMYSSSITFATPFTVDVVFNAMVSVSWFTAMSKVYFGTKDLGSSVRRSFISVSGVGTCCTNGAASIRHSHETETILRNTEIM